MAKFFIAGRNLASLMAATPGILVVGADALPLTGLEIEVWYGLRLGDDRARIGRLPPLTESDDEVEIPVAPNGILTLLLGKNEPAALWQEWFAETQGQAAPEVATDNAAALCVIASRLISQQARILREHADLQLSMSRLRQDLDQMRMVATGPLAQQPTSGLTLLNVSEPATASIRLDNKHTTLVQPLATRLDRIAAIALAVLAVKGDAVMRARLSAVESGRIFGSWLVPLGTSTSGWLTLELPSSLGWVPETAQLEMHFAGSGDAHVDLAQDRKMSFPENLPRRGAAVAADHSLAVRIWGGDGGQRYVAPEHWDMSEVGRAAHPRGIPLGMPVAAWARVLVVQGGRPKPHHPDSSSLMIIGVNSGEQTFVVFPLVSLAGMDMVEVRLTVRGGDPGNLSASIWFQPLGHKIADEGDFLLEGSNVAWSGWHPFDPRGEARATLEVPASSSGNVQFIVALESSAQTVAALSLVNINKVQFHSQNLGRNLQRSSSLVGIDTLAGALLPNDEGPAAEDFVTFNDVILDEHFDNKETYAHLDMRLSKFTVRHLHWRFLKFRMVVDQGEPCLEFRDIASWPPSLRRWPEGEGDSHGRFLRLFGRESELLYLHEQAAAEDLILIEGLVHCLRKVVDKAVILAALDPVGRAFWDEKADELARKLSGRNNDPLS